MRTSIKGRLDILILQGNVKELERRAEILSEADMYGIQNIKNTVIPKTKGVLPMDRAYTLSEVDEIIEETIQAVLDGKHVANRIIPGAPR